MVTKMSAVKAKISKRTIRNKRVDAMQQAVAHWQTFVTNLSRVELGRLWRGMLLSWELDDLIAFIDGVEVRRLEDPQTELMWLTLAELEAGEDHEKPAAGLSVRQTLMMKLQIIVEDRR